MVIKQTRCTLNHTNAQYLIFMLGPSFQKHNSPHSDHDKNNAILTLSKSVLHWFIVLCPPAKFWSLFVQYFTEIGHLRHSKKILSVIFFTLGSNFNPYSWQKLLICLYYPLLCDKTNYNLTNSYYKEYDFIKDCWGGMKNEINIMSNQIESVWYLISGGCFFLLFNPKCL